MSGLSLARSFALLSVAAGLPCFAGSPAEYTVFDAGTARTLRLVSPVTVVDVENPGEVLAVRPRVTVPVARRSAVAELADSYAAGKWEAAAVGGFYIFFYETAAQALAAAEKMYRDGIEASPIVLRQRRGRFTPSDPFWLQQWHLRNTGLRRGLKGIDLNVVPAWRTVSGKGVTVGVVDDGLQVNHPDLRSVAWPRSSEPGKSLHYDFNGLDTDPTPSNRDYHGTAVAGLAAAAANKLGGVGVAPGARLAGLRLTADYASDSDEAAAFGWKNNIIQIYNNSWGPDDSGETVEGPGPLAAAKLRSAAIFGRGGRGNIFVWSGGNGAAHDDANYDGYANSIYTLAVGAVSDLGVLTTESEAGCNLLVVAPSSSRMRQGLITTDLTGARGYNINGANDGYVLPSFNLVDTDYTNDFGMTSGAAPQISGVVALMLEANPNLGWRDVKEILIRTAKRVHVRDNGWKKNGAGFWFNDRYGAGLADASAAVTMAQGWKNLGGLRKVRVPLKGLNLSVPDGNSKGVRLTFDLGALENLRVEHVQLVVSASHAWRGDLRYQLNSPSGMSSVVAVRRYDRGQRLRNWTFMSVQHWGEASRGVWTLDVSDRLRGDSGVIESAELIIHGTPILLTARR